MLDGGSDERREIPVATVRRLLHMARELVDDTIRANRRDDGMYHSYNRLVVRGREAEIHHLELMLEGQVAVLGSGLLDDAEALALLDALRASPLYRADQRSYMLQPDRQVPSFMERNRLPVDWRSRCPSLAERVAAGDGSVVVVDRDGTAHFHADFATVGDLVRGMEWMGLDAADREALLAVWEEVFQHAGFTGRSGTFFAFEGLGSIYWHMVAKLLLAVQECHARAAAAAKPRFRAAYESIRDGLGFRKSPEEYGAFPTDAYSHTPRHAGAQQPGMTGQVKEEILTRLGELGVTVEAGRVRFRPELLPAEELAAAADFEFIDLDGRERIVPVPAGGVAFTLCQVPVVYVPAAEPAIAVGRREGGVETHAGDTLPAAASRELFGRTGSIVSLTVHLDTTARESAR